MKVLEKRFLYRSKDGPRIIIVGAGAAGLAAATRLMRQGYKNLRIIEAEDRIGGRIHSVPLGDGGNVVDLGAHWVHGERDNAVFELAEPLELVSSSGDFERVHFIGSDRSEISPEVGMSIFSQIGVHLEDRAALKAFPGSLYDFIMEKCGDIARQELGGELLEAYMEWLVKFECTIEGCNSLVEPSACGLGLYRRCEGDQINHWEGGRGYQTLLELLMGGLSEKPEEQRVDLTEKLLLSTEVRQIDYSGLGVTVSCDRGRTFSADYLILTVSLGVLKERYRTLFQPPLAEEKRRAILGLSIGTVDKVYLRFPYSWWPEDCSGFSLLWMASSRRTASSPLAEIGEGWNWERELIGFYTEANSPDTLTGWLVGEAARDMESYTTEQVKEGCIRVLRKFLGHKYDIPEPIAALRSSWYSNPHFRGSYSFRSLTTEALGVSAADLAQPLANSIGREVVQFAGEATHDHFYSTVHGAVETGWREADRLIANDRKNMKSQ